MPTILGANSDTGAYEISNSLVLYGGDSKLTQTPGSDGDRQKWTWNGWVKRTGVEDDGMLFSVGTYTRIQFSSDTLYVQVSNNDSTAHAIQTDRKFRDPAAWYMITVAVDTTQGTAANRCVIWVNGEQQSMSSNAGTPSGNITAFQTSLSNSHFWGGIYGSASGLDNAYLTQCVYCDGQAYSASNFGETDSRFGKTPPQRFCCAHWPWTT